MSLKPSFSRPARRRSSRGFSLIELMLVVIIIGVVAMLAAPAVVIQLREMRSRDAAQQVANVFTQARLRAIGRGSAVLVRYNNVTGFRIFDAVEGQDAVDRGEAGCVNAPGSGCLSTDWAVAINQRLVSAYQPQADIAVVGKDPGGTTRNDIRVCYSAAGRSFVSYVAADPTTPMAGSVEFTVKRGPAGLLRRIALLPNGNARLAL